MDYQNDFDISRAMMETTSKANEILGEPIDPPQEKIMELWNGTITYLQPRSFVQLIDLRSPVPLYSSGMSKLGFSDNHQMTPNEIKEMLHVNQRALFAYQTHKLYGLLLSRPELVKRSGFVYCCSRSFRGADKSFWLVHQSSKPIQYDKNGFMVRYLSTYTILGKYNGEPLKTEIYTAPEFRHEEKLLKSAILKFKVDILEGLGFTKQQEYLITLMNNSVNTNETIMESMRIKKKALDKHRQGVLNRGKMLFPENDFNFAIDVVKYLKIQDII